MKTKSKLVLPTILILLSARIFAQGTGAVVLPQQGENTDNDAWSFAAAGYG
jgi:hypothetical protein